MVEFVLGYLKPKGTQGGFERDAAESQNCAHVCHLPQRRGEETSAGSYLIRQGLIFRRNTTHGVRDPAVDKNEPIVDALIVKTAGKPKIEKCLVEKHARVISREGTPGPVRTFQARGKPDYKKRRIGRTEGRDWGIKPIWEFNRVRVTEISESWAIDAIALRFARPR